MNSVDSLLTRATVSLSGLTHTSKQNSKPCLSHVPRHPLLYIQQILRVIATRKTKLLHSRGLNSWGGFAGQSRCTVVMSHPITKRSQHELLPTPLRPSLCVLPVESLPSHLKTLRCAMTLGPALNTCVPTEAGVSLTSDSGSSPARRFH